MSTDSADRIVLAVGNYSVVCSAVRAPYDVGPSVVFMHGWAGTRRLWKPSLLELGQADLPTVARQGPIRTAGGSETGPAPLGSETGPAPLGSETGPAPLGRPSLTAVDMPGFGESGPAPDDVSPAGLGCLALQIATAIDPSGFILVGHSLGALVALEAVLQADPARHPIRGLILVSPPDPADLRLRTSLFRTRLTGMPVALAFQAIGRIAARGPVPTGRGRASRWVRRRAESVGTSAHVLYEAAHHLATTPRLEPPATSHFPVLVVVGDKDRTVSPAVGQRVAKVSDHSNLVVIPNAGHHVMESQPELFAAALRDWLTGVVAGS